MTKEKHSEPVSKSAVFFSPMIPCGFMMPSNTHTRKELNFNCWQLARNRKILFAFRGGGGGGGASIGTEQKLNKYSKPSADCGEQTLRNMIHSEEAIENPVPTWNAVNLGRRGVTCPGHGGRFGASEQICACSASRFCHFENLLWRLHSGSVMNNPPYP